VGSNKIAIKNMRLVWCFTNLTFHCIFVVRLLLSTPFEISFGKVWSKCPAKGLSSFLNLSEALVFIFVEICEPAEFCIYSRYLNLG